LEIFLQVVQRQISNSPHLGQKNLEATSPLGISRLHEVQMPIQFRLGGL
jgi:hypothetical protein